MRFRLAISDRRDGIFLLLAAAALLLLASRFLDNPIIFDDYAFFNAGSPERFVAAGIQFSPRWWVFDTFAAALVYLGHGLRELRLGNLAAHLATAIALYFLLRRLLIDIDKGPVAGFKPDAAAFTATMLFLLHPLAISTQGYLIQRTILIATLFSLLSAHAFWRGLNGNRLALSLSCVFALVAIYAKEHAVMIPAVSGLLFVLHRRSGLEVPRPAAIWITLGVQALIALMALLQMKGFIGSVYEPTVADAIPLDAVVPSEGLYPLSVLNQAGLFFKYLSLWLLPDGTRLSIDMREPFPLSFASFSLWLYAALFLLYCGGTAAMLLKGGTRGLLGFALLAPGILFLTEFSVVRLAEPFVLYRSYLWMPLLFVVVAVALRRFSASFATAIGMVVALALFAFSVDRLTTLSNSWLAWNEAAELMARQGERPGVFGAYRIYYNRGKAAYKEGLLDDALADFDRVIETNPRLGHAYYRRGLVLLSRKEWMRAAADFERAMILMPRYAESYRGRAEALDAMGKREEARKTREIACLLDSDLSSCRK